MSLLDAYFQCIFKMCGYFIVKYCKGNTTIYTMICCSVSQSVSLSIFISSRPIYGYIISVRFTEWVR
jgi:hypothetical protein